MKDCSLLLLTVLVLQGARGVLMEACNGVTNINELVSQYSLKVSTSFSSDGSSLSLNCTINNGTANLQPGQELVWTEGGIEIQDGTIGYSVHQTNTSSLLTISITHGLHKLIVTGSFIQHCSDKTTTTAAPQSAPAPIITTHNVSSPGQTVSITCNQSMAVLVKEHSNGSLVETINNITVSSPNDQEKFGCILNDTILEIHYVTIKACAVYSPLPLQSFQITFRTGNFIVGGLQNTYTSSSPIEDLYRLSMVPNAGNDRVVDSLDFYCTASTLWDTVGIERYRVDFDTQGIDLIPSVCVTTSLTPASPAPEGSTVTITCHIQYDISVDINVSILRNTNEVLTNFSLQGYNHSYVIKSVKEKDEGNYTCMVTGIATTLSDSIDLQVIPAQISSSSSRSHSTSLSLSLAPSLSLSLAPSPSPFMSSDNIPVPTPTGNEVTTAVPSDGPSSTVIVVASISSGLALLILLVITFLFGFFVGKRCNKNTTEERRGRSPDNLDNIELT
uniref:Ig-like domain-containing protein n=1 Tax=Amphimedon queenslandica TaxID=400682 RepID=A0A1X7TZ74_AMPQE